MPKTYADLLEELAQRGLFHIEPGLERVQAVLGALGDPQNRTPSIHIAGTNGKGSVAAGLESVLRAAGFRTGFYSSPHLVDWLERFRIDGTPASAAAFLSAARRVLTTEKRLKLRLTHFEFLTVCAFVLMDKAGCDILILEAGMGGRWDATNAIARPLVCVITSIGLDHTQWLGETEAAIAQEKAGIIKPGVCVVSGARGPGRAVIRRAARAAGSALRQLDLDFSAEAAAVSWEENIQTLSYRGQRPGPRLYRLGLLGSHQIDNAAIVLCVIEVLRELGWSLAERAVRDGLRRVQWPCRFQVIQEPNEPALILDGAHNPHALRQFLTTLQKSPWGQKPKTVIFSAYRDKDHAEMARMLAPITSRLVLCALSGRRGLSLQALRDAFPSGGFSVHLAATPAAALDRAWRETSSDGVVIATGSLALTGLVWAAQPSIALLARSARD